MDNILKLLLGQLVFIAFIGLVQAEEPKSFPKRVENTLKKELEAVINKHNLPGANIGIWIPGKGEWAHSFGMANKSAKEPLKLECYFRIGSITKTFVTTAILQLVDKGLISLDDKIGKHINNVPNGDIITIRQLANMTSGLANYSENDEWLDKIIFSESKRFIPAQELLDVAFAMPILFEPGKGWKYSNTNTVLLGQVIEKKSGLSLDKYLQKNIFEPLELDHTLYPTDHNIPTPYAHGYTKQTIDGKEADASLNNPSWTNAAGQLISTIGDLKKWAKALGTGALLSKKVFEERTKWANLPPNTDKRHYGLGVGFNNGWIYHTGELPGYNSIAAYLPKEQAIIVIMVNTDMHSLINGKPEGPADIIFEAIRKILTSQNVPLI